MKKNLLLLITMFVVLLNIQSCKKEETSAPPKPTANFTYTGGGCVAPCVVLCNNQSKNATSYEWDFGDGFKAYDLNPSHTYYSSGIFTITLTAKGEGGTATFSSQVLIQQSQQSLLPSPNFTFAGTGSMAPSIVTFGNTSTNATSYSWEFGDGGTSTSENPSHTYTYGGTFSVTLTATNSTGSKSISKNINVLPAPTKVIISKVTITNMPFVDDVSGSGWDPSDGPDTYIKITDKQNNVLIDGSGSILNDIVPSKLPLSWNITSGLTVTDFTSPIFVDLWDYDTFDPDDYIGYAGFNFSYYTSGANAYPSSITITQNGITAKLDISWK